jgi:hypothetical protein
MQRANIHDRSSIEQIYPHAVYESESQANTRAKVSVLNGVRITSAADSSGAFNLTRASHHVGEQEQAHDSVFLCPFALETSFAARRDAYGAYAERQNARAGVRGEYEAFIDKIIATARTARLERPTGRGDARLRGPRQ